MHKNSNAAFLRNPKQYPTLQRSSMVFTTSFSQIPINKKLHSILYEKISIGFLKSTERLLIILIAQIKSENGFVHVTIF